MLGCSRGRNTSYALFLVLPTGRSLLTAAGESPLAYSLGMDLGRLQLRTGLTLYNLWHTPDLLLKLFTTGKDSLLDQTLARLLKFLLHYLCHFFFFLRSSFSKNLAEQFNQTLLPPCLITLIYDQNPHPPPSPRWCLISLVCLQPESPYPWCILLVSFHPLSPTLLFGYQLPVDHTIFRIEPSSVWGFFPPITIVLNKICFFHFNCCELCLSFDITVVPGPGLPRVVGTAGQHPTDLSSFTPLGLSFPSVKMG